MFVIKPFYSNFEIALLLNYLFFKFIISERAREGGREGGWEGGREGGHQIVWLPIFTIHFYTALLLYVFIVFIIQILYDCIFFNTEFIMLLCTSHMYLPAPFTQVLRFHVFLY